MSDQKLRLLFLPRETYPSFRGRIEVLFGRNLIQRGHQIDLVMQAGDEKAVTGPVQWYGRTVWVGKCAHGKGAISRITRVCMGLIHDLKHILRARTDQYDAVLISDKFLVAAVAIPVLRARGLPVLFWLTFPYPEALQWRGANSGDRLRMLLSVAGYLSAALLYKWILPRSRHIFVQSPKMGQNLAARGADKSKMSPVLTGVDLADFPERLNRSNGAERVFEFVYLGTLVRQRRLTVLVEMIALLRDSGLQARLILIGDGERPEDKVEILETAARLGVQGLVEITGFLPRNQALQRAGLADVGLSPFFPNEVLEVASPTKLVEYMTLEIPSIANDQPDQRTVLRASRAGICVPWGAKYFARAARHLMSMPEQSRKEMGIRGRAWVTEHRSYARIADDFESAALQAIKRTPQ